MSEGFITKIVADRGFGFISSHGRSDIFFHFSALADGLEFDELLLERRIKFDVVETDRGQQAANVRPAAV